MKAAVRCQSLDLAGLARAEKHGKRLDWIGKQRQVRDRAPLTVGGLDLSDAYAQHIEGARQNKGAKKPVLHFLVKFPAEILGDDAPTPYAEREREEREKLMLRQAVRFINQSHGGNAVFAARLDRDEDGETVVDVFACPRYLKESRSGRREPSHWTSATKFGEELARKHQAHIRTRFKDADTSKPITSPRAVGIALQEEFAEFFERENGVKLERRLKDSRSKDRLEVEEWKLRQTENKAREIINAATEISEKTEEQRDRFKDSAREWVARNKADLDSRRAELDKIEEALTHERAEVRKLREKLRRALDMVKDWIRAPDRTATERNKGKALLNVINADRDLAPKKPREESDDMGPGF